MAEVDLTRIQDMFARVPGVRLPPAGNTRVGRVAPEHGTTHERPPRTPMRTGREAPDDDPPDARPTAPAAQLEELNREAESRNLRFEPCDRPEGPAVQVIDTRTGAVLRIVPAAALARFRQGAPGAVGLVLDTRL
ncbi:MAG TPA: hypothetical protein DCM87_02110 [Planctomycetes bacterium]|nr:hypothetical protein [Planctomycetota bacterium]